MKRESKKKEKTEESKKAEPAIAITKPLEGIKKE